MHFFIVLLTKHGRRWTIKAQESPVNTTQLNIEKKNRYSVNVRYHTACSYAWKSSYCRCLRTLGQSFLSCLLLCDYIFNRTARLPGRGSRTPTVSSLSSKRAWWLTWSFNQTPLGSEKYKEWLKPMSILKESSESAFPPLTGFSKTTGGAWRKNTECLMSATLREWKSYDISMSK